MSSTQSVPASDASKSQLDAATKAVQDLSVHEGGDQEHKDHDEQLQQQDVDEDGEDGEDAEALATEEGGAASTGNKKKKKKSKSKGKGKAALDKLKGALTGNSNSTSTTVDTAEDDSPSSSSTAGKKLAPPISNELYKRILDEAKKNLSPEEAAKLDRQAVAEMVEGE
jgi:hypothetical protein